MPTPEQLCSHATPKTKYTCTHKLHSLNSLKLQKLAGMKCASNCIACTDNYTDRLSLSLSLSHTHTHTHTHLALLVAIGQQLQAVCGDSQELGVALVQQGNHPLQAVSQTNSHLCSFLVQQQVVKCGDGVEEHRLHGRAEGEKWVCYEEKKYNFKPFFLLTFFVGANYFRMLHFLMGLVHFNTLQRILLK